jgi:hypothetical protein
MENLTLSDRDERREARPVPDPVVLHLAGMTPGALGPTMFARVLHCVRRAAAYYAADCHTIEAAYDPVTHEKTGYEITVQNAMIALRIRLCYDLARQCRPMPWVSG